MKRKLLLTIFILGFMLPTFSQVMFDFTVEVNTDSKNGKITAEVVVKLNLGETPIKYQIINGTRIKDAVLFESEFINKKNYTFKDIPEGKYLLKIVDEQGRMAWKSFEVSAESKATY
jgi:hypothetical protein